MIGSIVATFAYQQYETKTVLCAVTILEAISLDLFTMTANFYLLLLVRFITGFCQVFISIYFPVWADTFGSTEQAKTIWLNVLLLCSPLGVLFGYILCASLVSHGVTWRAAFWIQALGFIIPILAILVTPGRYFNLQKASRREQPVVDEAQNNISFTLRQPNIITSESTFDRIRLVMKTRLFVLLALALSTLYFITTGIQYWISDYLTIVLQVPQV